MSPASPSLRRLPRLIREPLLHFLLLAGLLFVAQWIFQGDSREVIEVDATTIDYLVQQEAELRLRPLTEAERQQLIESHIEEEILFREAQKRGYVNSSRVRRLLIQNMRFFLASDLPEPTDEDLQRHFQAYPERFTNPATLEIDNVFFIDPARAPADLLDTLKVGVPPGELGDDTPITEKRLYDMSERRIAGYFGAEGAREVLAIEDNDWHGPISSPRGVHFIRVAGRESARLPEFEQARSWVSSDWLMTQQRTIMDRALKEMSASYRIVMPGTGNGEAD